MKTILRLGAATVALALVTLGARATEPGYVDLGKFTPADGCEYVEVNLHSTVLKLAAMFAGHDDPQAADFLRSIKHVRVNVVGYNDSNHADVADRVKNIRHELEGQGWEQIVTVKEGRRDQDVAIYLKSHTDDAIDGLVVTVIDSCKKEAVLVNVVGNIKPEQIAALGKDLHIGSLSDLTIDLPAKKT